ncbi:MAG: imidazoleglycerol-phosphate dehydratase, partial [Candidatus Omnitrophota bacterium]|nr:imidazoleglycerol-phosphate dehydratase [Candidatus Omnitrophota bacterium]
MREANRNRKSKETDITVKLNIDGAGVSKINSGIG